MLCCNVNTTIHSFKLFTPQITIVSDSGIKATSKGTDVNCCVKVGDWQIPLQYWLSVQRWADGITIWPNNAVLTINHPLGVHIVCLGYLWILSNVDEHGFQNLKNWCHPTEPLNFYNQLIFAFSMLKVAFLKSSIRSMILKIMCNSPPVPPDQIFVFLGQVDPGLQRICIGWYREKDY